MTESHYAINVKTNYGAHFCTIILSAILTEQEAFVRCKNLKTKFGSEFQLSLTYVAVNETEIGK